MALNYEAKPDRAQLNFGTEGLAAREELLLKSLIRLLDHRTLHQWTYHPEAADLWILAEDAHVPLTSQAAQPNYKVITLSHHQSSNENVLPLPLHAQDIENALNSLGRILTGALAAHSSVPTPSLAATSLFRLTRWPPANLLDTADRIRLATLLLGPPLSLEDAVRRSNSTQTVCTLFIADLKQAGCIELSHSQALIKESQGTASVSKPTAVQQTKPLSLFERIRNRLAQPILGYKPK